MTKRIPDTRRHQEMQRKLWILPVKGFGKSRDGSR